MQMANISFDKKTKISKNEPNSAPKITKFSQIFIKLTQHYKRLTK